MTTGEPDSKGKDPGFPYNLPIWRRSFQLKSPDGMMEARISQATEASMGNPTVGTLELSNGFVLNRCNPSFIWSDDSRYLAVPRYFTRFALFRRQHLLLIDVVDGCVFTSSKSACYFQPESFRDGKLVVIEEPQSDAIRHEWHIPRELDQFKLTTENLKKS